MRSLVAERPRVQHWSLRPCVAASCEVLEEMTDADVTAKEISRPVEIEISNQPAQEIERADSVMTGMFAIDRFVRNEKETYDFIVDDRSPGRTC
jgi:hypothetical protein